jgi:glycopeptide antibiotics resistance protein
VKAETKRGIRFISWILFALYIILLTYLLFLSEGYGRKDFAVREYRYNLVPFLEIRRFWVYRERVGYFAAFLNLGGNVIGFLPLGFFLPVLSNRFRNGFLITCLGFGFSLLVESLQLVMKVGCFDVDDLILNTVGALLGYVMFRICNWLRRLIYEKKI